MSSKKSPIVEKSVEHSVSPIRDVLLVPPGAIGATGSSDEESMHTHPALLVEQRSSPTPSPNVISANNNGIVAVKSSQSHKSHKSEKENAVSVSPKTRRERRIKVKGKGRGNIKRTRHAGGGKGTRKKYNRKLRTTRGRKRI